MGNYYKKFYNMDFRSIRYIGVISPMEYAYNGSTDYATEIFFKARKKEHYNICLKSSTRLPMAYIDDVIDGTMQLLEAPKDNLTVGTYNMNCVDFSPLELYTEVKKYYPELTVDYKPDIRDTMANSWPHHYDDTSSRNDWGWNPKYDTLEKLVKIMYDNTSFKTNETKI